MQDGKWQPIELMNERERNECVSKFPSSKVYVRVYFEGDSNVRAHYKIGTKAKFIGVGITDEVVPTTAGETADEGESDPDTEWIGALDAPIAEVGAPLKEESDTGGGI